LPKRIPCRPLKTNGNSLAPIKMQLPVPVAPWFSSDETFETVSISCRGTSFCSFVTGLVLTCKSNPGPNAQDETYLFNSKTCQFAPLQLVVLWKSKNYDISGFDTAFHFKAGTHIQAENNLNGEKYGPTDEQNVWIRVQQCVYGCHFQARDAKPSVIRHHFSTCKKRQEKFADLEIDYLERLCALQLGIMKKQGKLD